MDFSLSNSLVSTAVSNPDKLSLDLQFATDKTLTARKGPTPTFTRASTATFVGSNGLIQSAAVNAARFDHDPVTLASKGLLIEESRTNLCLQSQTFQITWTATQLNTTGTPTYLNVATAPDGTTTADKLIANTSSVLHQFRQDVTLVSGTTYSFTCYLKAAEQQFASFAVFGVANGNLDWTCLFNVSSSPSVGSNVGFTSTSVTNAGNGWIRCTAVFTATASGAISIRIGGAGNASAGGQFYMGDNSSGILVWGAQLEAGAFPTSYIPTTTASVVRSADVCSITGSAFTGFYNQSEGTIYAAYNRPTINQFGSIVTADIGTDAAKIQLSFRNTNQADISIKDSVNGVTFEYLPNNVYVNGINKHALGYIANNAVGSVNSAFSGVDTTVTIPSPIILIIGSDSVGSGRRINGTISAIRYFRKRLSNAKIQALTAP